MADGGIIFELFLCKLDAQFEVRCVVLSLLVVVERLLEDVIQLPAHALPVRLVALGCVVHLIRAKAQPSSLQQLQSSSLQKVQPSSLQLGNQVRCSVTKLVAKRNQSSLLQSATKFVAKHNQVRCKPQPSSLPSATNLVAKCSQVCCSVFYSVVSKGCL